MRIADKIQDSLNAVTNWTEGWESVFLGLTFGKLSPTVIDTMITNAKSAGDWLTVARYKRIAELIGYSSTTIDDAVKAFLTNIPMFTSAPIPIITHIDDVPYFAPDYSVVLNGYRWAKELSWETARWNPDTAYAKLRDIRVGQAYPFFGVNPDTNQFYRVFPTCRWHESASMSFAFLKFLENNVEGADTLTLWEWGELNRIYWAGDHYNYSPDLPGWEMAAPTTFFYVTKLHIKFLRSLGEFYRVVNDTEARYLSRQWCSPQWGTYKVIIHHNPANTQRSLDYYLPAMGLLHMLYPQMSNDGKANFKGMLDGSIAPRMADALLASELYSAPRFRMRSGGDLSDTATAYGAATLFLQAVIPDTGSLAIPVYMEGMEQRECTFFDVNHFGFDYTARKIKIPVYAGKIRFYFGDSPVEYTFPYDGVYTVTFTSDWNSIASTQWVDTLRGEFLAQPTPPPSALTQISILVLLTASVPFIIPVARELVKTVKEKGEEAVVGGR